MSSDAVVRRLIEDLRALAADCHSPFDHHRRLVDALEWRLAHPDPRGWDVVLTCEDAHDRLALAEWLDHQVTVPAFTSPSWGRSGSATDYATQMLFYRCGTALFYAGQIGGTAARYAAAASARGILSTELRLAGRGRPDRHGSSPRARVDLR